MKKIYALFFAMGAFALFSVLVLMVSRSTEYSVPRLKKSEIQQDDSQRSEHQKSSHDGVPGAVSKVAEVPVPVPVRPTTQDGPSTIGEQLAHGIESMSPAQAFQTAIAVPRCGRLSFDLNLIDGRIAREPEGAAKVRLRKEKEGLMALMPNCQTIPAEYQTLGGEYQLRARLLKHAYAASISGSAAQLMQIPEQFSGVPATELRERANHDALGGDVQTMATLLMKADSGSLDDQDLKMFAFALQRAARDPELRAYVETTQALFSQVLEERWQPRTPGVKPVSPQGFKVDSQGAFLYPQGYEEPRDEAYRTRAKELDAALAKTARIARKPS
jgi:hypothetical protein